MARALRSSRTLLISLVAIMVSVARPEIHAAPSEPTSQNEALSLVRKLGLVESAKPVREQIRGWRKPTRILVALEVWTCPDSVDG